MHRIRRVVVEIREGLHRKLRKQAILNDVRIYELTNAIVEEFLKDPEHIRETLKQLRV